MWDTEDIKLYYDQLKKNGQYATLAPNNKGGYKSQYVATVFEEAVIRYFENSDHPKVLDLGCGTGILSNKLADLTSITVGVDISLGMLELAKETAHSDRAAYVQIDGKRLPFKDQQVDSVIARESLCHIPDEGLPGILAEINRVMRSNGSLYILDQFSESAYWQSQGDFIRRRSVSEFLEICSKYGFERTESYVVRQPRFFWIYLFWFRLLPKKLMRPLAKLEVLYNKRFVRLETNRWHDVLFIFRKVR